MKKRNKTGFLVMNLEKDWWNESAVWQSYKASGENYDKYNQIPMFRYNTYFGIHTVHYYNLNDVADKHKLDMENVLAKGTFRDFKATALGKMNECL